jgi:hypothetical protein
MFRRVGVSPAIRRVSRRIFPVGKSNQIAFAQKHFGTTPNAGEREADPLETPKRSDRGNECAAEIEHQGHENEQQHHCRLTRPMLA